MQLIIGWYCWNFIFIVAMETYKMPEQKRKPIT